MFLLFTLLGLLPSATAALPALGAPPGPIESVGTCPPPAYREPGKPRLDEFQHLCDGWCADPTIGLKDPHCTKPVPVGQRQEHPFPLAYSRRLFNETGPFPVPIQRQSRRFSCACSCSGTIPIPLDNIPTPEFTENHTTCKL
jgi:hypothetical protein